MRRTYFRFSVAAWVVWIVLLSLVELVRPHHSGPFIDVFAGWVIGWTSATIARRIYPAPRHHHDR